MTNTLMGERGGRHGTAGLESGESIRGEGAWAMAEQMPFGDVELATNPEPRCPCVLLLDVSGSMAGEPIAQLNAGLQAYHADLLSDPLAAQRVEVAVITFGGIVQTVTPFQTAHHFSPPTLAATGDTPMGLAIRQAIDAVAERKRLYRQNGLHYYRPWIFLITDGAPTDAWKAAADLVHQGEAQKAFAFFAVGVAGANFDVLRKIAIRAPLELKGLSFRELFVWLSQSQRSVSHSNPGQEDQVKLAPPTGWANL
jgi:uncharacterized protein YegL